MLEEFQVNQKGQELLYTIIQYNTSNGYKKKFAIQYKDTKNKKLEINLLMLIQTP